MKIPNADINEEVLKLILEKVETEFRRASSVYPRFNSAHEGYCIILEECDELFDEVKKLKGVDDWTPFLLSEAVQLTSMGIRFIHDCCRLERIIR